MSRAERQTLVVGRVVGDGTFERRRLLAQEHVRECCEVELRFRVLDSGPRRRPEQRVALLDEEQRHGVLHKLARARARASGRLAVADEAAPLAHGRDGLVCGDPEHCLTLLGCAGDPGSSALDAVTVGDGHRARVRRVDSGQRWRGADAEPLGPLCGLACLGDMCRFAFLEEHLLSVAGQHAVDAGQERVGDLGAQTLQVQRSPALRHQCEAATRIRGLGTSIGQNSGLLAH